MKIRIKPPLLPQARIHRLVRWSRYLLWIVGIVSLAYVGFTVLDARLYQENAKQSLETQVLMVKGPNLPAIALTIKEGDIVGRMDIPRLGVSVAVLEGTSSRMLRLGAGHIAGTPLPGDSGNSAIAGHRDTFFRELRNIRNDDEIRLQTPTGLIRYEVDWTRVVAPDDMTVLETSTTAESTLTLVTCYPFYFVGPAPNRFVVHARKD